MLHLEHYYSALRDADGDAMDVVYYAIPSAIPEPGPRSRAVPGIFGRVLSDLVFIFVSVADLMCTRRCRARFAGL